MELRHYTYKVVLKLKNNMKCIIKECESEASPGWPCCSANHGYSLKKIRELLNSEDLFTANENIEDQKNYELLIKQNPKNNWMKPMRMEWTIADVEYYQSI